MLNRLSEAQLRALEMLDAAGFSGRTQAVMLASGIKPATIDTLVRAGLATATAELVRAGGLAIEIVDIRITDTGRAALSTD